MPATPAEPYPPMPWRTPSRLYTLEVVIALVSKKGWLASVSSAEAKHEVKSTLFLDVVIAQGPAILQLLASKDKSLLVWWDTLLILNLRLDVIDRVG